MFESNFTFDTQRKEMHTIPGLALTAADIIAERVQSADFIGEFYVEFYHGDFDYLAGLHKAIVRELMDHPTFEGRIEEDFYNQDLVDEIKVHESLHREVYEQEGWPNTYKLQIGYSDKYFINTYAVAAQAPKGVPVEERQMVRKRAKLNPLMRGNFLSIGDMENVLKHQGDLLTKEEIALILGHITFDKGIPTDLQADHPNYKEDLDQIFERFLELSLR